MWIAQRGDIHIADGFAGIETDAIELLFPERFQPHSSPERNVGDTAQTPQHLHHACLV